MRYEVEAAIFVVEGPIDEQEPPWRQHAAHLVPAPLARLVQIVSYPGVGVGPKLDGELPAIRRLDKEAVGFFAVTHHIAGDGVGE